MKTIKKPVSLTKSKYILADSAYNSDKLDLECKKLGISLVA